MTLAADLQDALEPLAQVLQQLGIRYYIGSLLVELMRREPLGWLKPPQLQHS